MSGRKGVFAAQDELDAARGDAVRLLRDAGSRSGASGTLGRMALEIETSQLDTMSALLRAMGAFAGDDVLDALCRLRLAERAVARC